MNEIKLQTVINTILVSAIIIIAAYGLLSIDFSAQKFKKSPIDIHTELVKNEYLINIESVTLNDSINDFVLVDLRTRSDFEKGHFENALHIFAPQITEKESLKFFETLNKENKTTVLYSHTPQEAMGSWYMLTSLGFENIKVLNVSTNFINNEFSVEPFNAEILKNDIAQFIKESNEVKIIPKVIESIKKPLQVVKPIKKEKIEVEEGGC